MFFRIGSFEFFIEPAPQFPFFKFDHIKHSPRAIRNGVMTEERELWLMWRHIVMARRT